MKLIQHFFFFFIISKILPKSTFELNFSIQSQASLTHPEPTYLQITFHYVYYLKYTELKNFFGHRIWAPKPVYRLLDPSGNVWIVTWQKST